MARFLFTIATAVGHIQPMLPVARLLVRRGHHVGWMGGRGYKEVIDATGAEFIPYPLENDMSMSSFDEVFPMGRQLKGLAQVKYLLTGFLDLVPPLLPAIRTALDHFPAQAVISDPAILAPYYLTELGGPPSVLMHVIPLAIPSRDTPPYGLGLLPGTTLLTRFRDRLLNDLVGHWLLRDLNRYANRVRQQVHLPPLRAPFLQSIYTLPSLVVQFCSPAFEYPRRDLPANVRFAGPVLPEPAAKFQAPAWWPDLARLQPVILVNQGTIADDLRDLVIPLVTAFAHEPLLVVAVPVKPGDLPDLPGNVRAEPFIPFDRLLPFVDVMVTNGGYGGTQMALSRGIPLVVAGDTEDKMEVSARVEWIKAGINLHTRRPSASRLKSAVLEVLRNPSYRRHARRIQEDMAGYQGPQRVVQLLEELVKPAPSPGITIS